MDCALAVDREAHHVAAYRADDRKLVESARIVANETHGQALMRERTPDFAKGGLDPRSEEHMSELQSHSDLVCRLLLEKKKKIKYTLINRKKKKTRNKKKKQKT